MTTAALKTRRGQEETEKGQDIRTLLSRRGDGPQTITVALPMGAPRAM